MSKSITLRDDTICKIDKIRSADGTHCEVSTKRDGKTDMFSILKM